MTLAAKAIAIAVLLAHDVLARSGPELEAELRSLDKAEIAEIVRKARSRNKDSGLLDASDAYLSTGPDNGF